MLSNTRAVLEQLVKTERRSIGITEGLAAAKIEIKTLLEQYEMFARQLEEILFEVERLLAQIPGTKEMLTVPGIDLNSNQTTKAVNFLHIKKHPTLMFHERYNEIDE